jgi:carbamoyl-phosphate synthase large subunit
VIESKNVLVLSAGRRVELVISFQEALKRYSPKAVVYTTDMVPELSSACQVSTKHFKAPRVTSEGYAHFLKKLCIDENIGLVIPTIDTELLLLAKHKQEFKESGIDLIISDFELIAMCRDKRKTAELFKILHIDQPKIYSAEDIQYPCFCKPYDGSCSIGAFVLKSADMLTEDILLNEKNMFMELISGEYTEYTIDAYYNKNGTLCCFVPRERIEVRAGEVSKGATRRNQVYEYLLDKLRSLVGAKGCITVQVFFNPETGAVKGLEINPRFGGGYPLTLSAGANYPEWLIREYLLDENIVFTDMWEPNLLMLRYDAKVIVSDSI